MKLLINKQSYACPGYWNELPLSEAIALLDLLEKQPPEIRRYLCPTTQNKGSHTENRPEKIAANSAQPAIAFPGEAVLEKRSTAIRPENTEKTLKQNSHPRHTPWPESDGRNEPDRNRGRIPKRNGTPHFPTTPEKSIGQNRENEKRQSTKKQPNEPKTEYRSETLLSCCRDIIHLLAKVPSKECARIDPDEATEFVRSRLAVFTTGLLDEPIYFPQGITSFHWNGEELFLPRFGFGKEKEPDRNSLPKLPAYAFCEAVDLLHEKGIRAAARIAAILCRPKGEPYISRKSHERAQRMTNLPMSTVWELFFLLAKTIAPLEQLFLNKPSDERILTLSGGMSWKELLFITARGIPSEWQKLSRMECGAFLFAAETTARYRQTGFTF